MLVICSLLLPLVAGQADYCQLSPQHTLCQYPGPGASCNGQPTSGVTSQEADDIIGVHNRYRSLVARGLESRGTSGGQPSAANMRQMTWDDELASIAQMHADQCKFEHDCTDCRKTERFGVGQNLYIYKQSVAAPANDWEQAVTDWYEEVEDFSNNNIEPFQFTSAAGHYTQVVWANSDKVGCGAMSYKDGRWFTTLYVCNYGPNGNFIKGQMYQQGPACSACEEGFQCSTEYEGLCVAGGSSSRPQSQPPPSNTISLPEQAVAVEATTIRFPISSRPTGRPATSQPTTTGLSNFIDDTVSGAELFNCNFDNKKADCDQKSKGKVWSTKNLFGNEYQEISLENQEKTESVFEQKISAPDGKIACLDFRFKKYTEGSGEPSFSVLAWPTNGQPGVVNIIQNSPDDFTWIRALVTLRNINTEWSLVVRATGPRSGSLTVGVDDIKVTEGKCAKA